MAVLRNSNNTSSNGTLMGNPPSAPSSMNNTSNGLPTQRPSPQRRTHRRRTTTTEVSFHPKLITAQIVSMQCMHYFLLAFLFQVNYVLYNKPISIDRIFTDRYVRIWNSSGWADVAAILLTSLAGYVTLTNNKLLERAR